MSPRMARRGARGIVLVMLPVPVGGLPGVMPAPSGTRAFSKRVGGVYGHNPVPLGGGGMGLLTMSTCLSHTLDGDAF